MDARRLPEYTLDILTDRANLKDITKGILHTIFFHRYFTPLYPATHEVLDLTLPYVSDDDVENLIDAKTTTLIRQIDIALQQHPQQPPRSLLVLQFLEKKRRKQTVTSWFPLSTAKPAEEETPWENWVLDISLLPSSSSPSPPSALSSTTATTTTAPPSSSTTTTAAASSSNLSPHDSKRQRATMEKSLHNATMRVLGAVNAERGHIPPITTNEVNPFPYQILVNPKGEGWTQRIGGYF